MEERPKGVLPIIIGKEEIGLASVEYSLAIHDGMSTALSVIDNSIQKTITSLMNFQRMNALFFNVSSFEKMGKKLDIIDGEYREITDSVSNVEKKQKDLGKATDDNEKKIKKLKDVWKSFVGGLDKMGIAHSPLDIMSQANNINASGNIIQAQTGMKGQNLDMAKQSAKNLFTDNMSKSPQEAAQSLSAVNQLTGKAGEGLEQTTRAGLLLQDAFGYGLTDSIKSAGTLQQQFGLQGAESFDLIIQATQAGLNKNGDLLETINASSDKFKELGLGGQEMFNMLVNGAQNGNVSISSIGNAVTEFSQKAVSGGKDASDGFASLGLDAGRMTEAFGSGGETAKQAFLETVNALNAMDDPVSKNIAGTKLFGNSWGELGQQGLEALSELNGSVSLSSQHLDELNQLKFNNASGAISSLANTINGGLAGPMTTAVTFITNIINDFTAGLQGKVDEINGIFGMLGLGIGIVGGFISDNWSIIAPILFGIIAALNAKAACDLVSAAATMVLAAAQTALNAAFWASPIGLIIAAVIILIVVFFAVIALVNKFTGTTLSATGLISGFFSAMAAVIHNIFTGIGVIFFTSVAVFMQLFGKFANFLSNVFTPPIKTVISLFFTMVDNIFGALQKVAAGIDAIFGSKFEATITAQREKFSSIQKIVEKKLEDKKNKDDEVNKKLENLDAKKVMEEFNFKPEFKNVEEEAKKGYEGGAKNGLLKGEFGNIKDILGGQNKPFDPDNYGDNLGADNQPDLSATQNNLNLNSQNNPNLSPYQDSISKNSGDTAASTAAMANTMDSMDEELKYMRDVAEQEIINRFTLADLKLDINNNNNIRNIADAESVTSMLNNSTSEALYSFAEGVTG
ncbi:hypothetical protein BET01_17895 [Lacrimispora algidixylanolytica]|uniref:Phage tail tape measure protein domain-containing protein n=1 Tax=Lacrimispora algidixylanolytica TaxID=94868 RepID=A0A419T3W2_9FIRM|nr:hypothetical protein BET01_17895 [Lacrimispora algidixylanolytica]